MGVAWRSGAIVIWLALSSLARCLVLRATGDEGADGAASVGESSSESTLMTQGMAGGMVPGSSSLMAG